MRPKRKEAAHRAHAPDCLPCFDRQEPSAKRARIPERVDLAKGDFERDLDHVLGFGLIQRDQPGGREENRAVHGKHLADLHR